MKLRELSESECLLMLGLNRVGRLACSREGRPYVVPINYAYADKRLYAFSMPGKKIDWLRANPLASVVVEAKEEKRGWRSVVVDGLFEELPDRLGHKVERDRAWGLLSRHANWWEPGALKPKSRPLTDRSPHIFFRIIIEQVSGREAVDED